MTYTTPSKEYIKFLKSVLSLENQEIEQYFKYQKVIPNKSLNDFVSANELYDMNEPLFRDIFTDSGKFLPLELQNDPNCLESLVRIGLKRQINHNTFIECVQEIDSKIKYNGFSASVVKERAKRLIRYLYEHVDDLNFNKEQWNKILEIKFVPSEKSEKNLPSKFYRTPKETTGFENFKTLCFHQYKKVCWTQCPLFDVNIEPSTFFIEHRPEIGIPSTEKIIEHWFMVVDNIESWKTSESYKEIKSVIKEIYEIMNEKIV